MVVVISLTRNRNHACTDSTYAHIYVDIYGNSLSIYKPIHGTVADWSSSSSSSCKGLGLELRLGL